MMLKMKQRETLKVPSNYLNDGIIRRFMDGETTELTRIVTWLMRLEAEYDVWWEESEYV